MGEWDVVKTSAVKVDEWEVKKVEKPKLFSPDGLQGLKGTPVGPGMPTSVEEMGSEDPTKGVVGLAEGVASIGTAIPAFIGGAGVGLLSAMAPGPPGHLTRSKELAEKIMELGYQPRTEEGKKAAAGLALPALPFQLAEKGIEAITPESASEETKSAIKLGTWGGMLATPSVIKGMRGKAKSTLEPSKGLFSAIKEFFTPGSTIPQGAEWLKIRQKAKGEMALGEMFAKKVVKRYEHLKPEQRQQIWEFMDGGKPITELPPNLQPIANRFRTIDDVIGRKLVERGVISPETFAENAGKHIKYIYDIHLGKGKTPIGVDVKAFKQRQTLTEFERERMGLVKDPLKSLALSITEGTRSAAMSGYFKAVGENPQWVFQPSVLKVPLPEGGTWKMGIGKAKELLKTFDEVSKQTPLAKSRESFRKSLEDSIAVAERQMGKPSGEFVQLNGAKYGELDGAYVNKTIANDVRPLWLVTAKDASKLVNVAKETIATGNAIWKMKNVALNVPTAMRNAVFSNPIQMNMSGVPMYKVPYYAKEAAKAMKNGDWRYKAAQKEGLTQTNFSATELNEILEIASRWDGTKFGGFLEGMKGLGKYYGKIDDFWKVAKFIEGKEKGLPNATAALEANKWVMDYSLVHPAVKEFRSGALGAPYITYTYKVLPLIAETAAKRPWILAKWMALPYALQEALKENMTDETAKKYLESLPEYVKNGQVLVIPGDKHANAIDMSYLLPWGNIWQVAQETKDGKIWKAAKELGVASGLLPSVMYALTMNQDLFTGQPIVSELGSYDPKTAATEVTNYIWGLSMPSMLTKHGVAGKIYEHERFGQTRQGLETQWYNAYPRMAGLNIYPVHPQGKRIKLLHDLKTVRKELARKMYDKNISPEERKKIKEIYKFAITDIVGPTDAGVGEPDLSEDDLSENVEE